MKKPEPVPGMPNLILKKAALIIFYFYVQFKNTRCSELFERHMDNGV